MRKNTNLILGHNSFFGINHLDYEKGKSNALKFKNNYKKIVDILKFALDVDVNKIMISTVDEANNLLKIIENDPIKEKLEFYILLPYLNKYVRKANELGIVGILTDTIKNQSFLDNLKTGIDFLSLVKKKNLKEFLNLLISVELRPFKNIKKKTVILHDALTDILIALKMEDIMQLFIKIVKEQFGCIPGFATKNFATFNKQLINLPNDIYVLTHANVLGFNMNPNKEDVEKELSNSKFKIILMSVLASGYLKPNEALGYVSKLKMNTPEIVIGCSSTDHVRQIRNLL